MILSILGIYGAVTATNFALLGIYKVLFNNYIKKEGYYRTPRKNWSSSQKEEVQKIENNVYRNMFFPFAIIASVSIFFDIEKTYKEDLEFYLKTGTLRKTEKSLSTEKNINKELSSKVDDKEPMLDLDAKVKKYQNMTPEEKLNLLNKERDSLLQQIELEKNKVKKIGTN